MVSAANYEIVRGSDGKERVKLGEYPVGSPITWLVLEKNGKDLLLLSEYGLDAKPFNSILESGNSSNEWHDCSLRSWLNDGFYSEAFSTEERGMIIEDTHDTYKNTANGEETTASVNDKVFLLSAREARKYFPQERDLVCSATAFAKEHGAEIEAGPNQCSWWLRSPAVEMMGLAQWAASIRADGSGKGWGTSAGEVCVRPVIRVKADKIKEDSHSVLPSKTTTTKRGSSKTKALGQLNRDESEFVTIYAEDFSVTSGANIDNLMKRARLFMEDGNWTSATEYLDKVLDENAEYAPAYVGKVQVEQHLSREDDLSECLGKFEDSANWKKAVRFATPEQKERYVKILSDSHSAREEHRKDGIYRQALEKLQNASSTEECESAKNIFASIPGFRDADEKQKECTEASLNLVYMQAEADLRIAGHRFIDAKTAQEYERIGNVFRGLGEYRNSNEKGAECYSKAEEIRNNLYNSACKKLESDDVTTLASAEYILQTIAPYFKDSKDKLTVCKEKIKDLKDYEAAKKKQKELDGMTHTINTSREYNLLAETFDSFGERYDSIDSAAECRRKAEAKAKAEAAKKKKLIAIIVALVILAIAAGVFFIKVIKPNNTYNSAISALNAGNYDEANN